MSFSVSEIGSNKGLLPHLLILLFISNSLFGSLQIGVDSIDTMHPLDSLEPKMRQLNSLGFQYYQDGDFFKADSVWTISLRINRKLYTDSDEESNIAGNYVNLGVANLKLWNYEYALELFNKAEKIFLNIDETHPYLGAIYVNKAIIFNALRDFDKALLYFEQAIDHYKNQDKISYESLYRAYRNLANLYSFTYRFTEAIECVETGILYDKYKSTSRLIDYYNMIAYYHSKLGNYESSESFYTKALYLAHKHKLEDQVSDYPSIQMNYGVYQMDELRNFNLARSLFFKALRNYMSLYGEYYHNNAICYQNLGEVYYNLELIDSSLYFLQKSLILENPDFNNDDVNTNPEINISHQRPRILNTLKFKAKVLSRKYDLYRDLEDLEFCLATYLSIYEYVDQMRLMYDTENSRILTSEFENETYLNGIYIAHKLFDLTNDNQYIDIAFQINEKRKVFTLLNSIRNTEAREFGGIPLNLLRDERILTKRLAAYDEHIYEENKKNNPDEDKIRIWENERFNTYKLYEDLITTFEEEYPEYYRLKYDASIFSVSQIQHSIKSDQLLIEYALSDSIIFIYSISRNSFKIIKRKIDSSFFSSAYFIWDQLTNPMFSSDARKSYQGYCKNSYNLYNNLLKPIKEELLNKDLLIVPDGFIWYIPFETLLSSDINDSIVNYRRLPYLLRDYAISYTYSATVYFEGIQRKSKPSKGLLAFAPDYSNLVAQHSNIDEEHLNNYRQNLVPIPGVKEEVRSIRRHIEGTVVFMDEEATESNFKKNAEHFDILHLAMHAIVNNEDPLYSKLAFTQKIDQVEDGFLNTYEIYNSHFNARMAVLSSCKSGFGKLMKGEGVMSLARGFMYAGCPSIVMTLWEVSDKSGARLMEDFYKSLKRGRSKAEALREAKLDFLKKADNLKAHPYFWSTYVVIGDSSPLFKKNLSYLYWLAAILLIAAGGLLYYIRQQRIIKGREAFKPDSLLS